ncbi:hypothetical protein, partial [Priestia sp. YIM B13490]|uniref:hypothetical protein n=1 Tax=Priestia sp. YIM B13490 TaxID=3366310 RepID=UPI0036735141
LMIGLLRYLYLLLAIADSPEALMGARKFQTDNHPFYQYRAYPIGLTLSYTSVPEGHGKQIEKVSLKS